MHEGSHEYVSLKNEGDKMIVAEKVSGFDFSFHIKWLWLDIFSQLSSSSIRTYWCMPAWINAYGFVEGRRREVFCEHRHRWAARRKMGTRRPGLDCHGPWLCLVILRLFARHRQTTQL